MRRARAQRILAAALALALIAPAQAAAAAGAGYAVSFAMDGVDGELADLLRRASNLAALVDQPPDAMTGLTRRIDADRARLDVVLRSEGYYAATLTISAEPAEKGVAVNIAVAPGPRYVFGETRLRLDPAAVEPELAAALRMAAAAPIGQPARADKVAAAQDALLGRLRREGYAFAAIDRQVIVDHDRRVMETVFDIRPGPAASFGLVATAGDASVADDLILGRLPWRQGDRYRPDLLDKARKEIAALGVFDGVSAVPTLSPDAGGVVPVTVRLEPRLRRFIGAGALYSSDDGFGVKAWWGHRNLFGRAERLRVDLAAARLGTGTVGAGGLGKTDFNLGASLEIPDFLTPRQDLRATLRAISENPAAYRRRAQVASVGLERRFAEGWTARVAVEQETAFVESNSADYRTAMIGPTASASWDASDNPLDPTRGFRVTADLAAWTPFAGEGAGSFIVAGVEGRVYHDLSRDGGAVLAGRLGVAAVAAQSLADVPPHRRLYAGGGASVRGYALQMAGPRDQLGDPTGGLSRIDGGVEVRVKVAESVGVVPFIDAAMVSQQMFGGFDDGVRAGAGLGMRYHTDFGPLRADLAFPLARERNDSLMQLYVSFGQAF